MARPPLFVHFTSPADAAAIVASRRLELSRTVAGAVYAVAAGGEAVPEVQQTALGTGTRTHAVLFHTEPPDWVFPEEAVWHRCDPLPITPVRVVAAVQASALLDGSLGLTNDGVPGSALPCAAPAPASAVTSPDPSAVGAPTPGPGSTGLTYSQYQAGQTGPGLPRSVLDTAAADHDRTQTALDWENPRADTLAAGAPQPITRHAIEANTTRTTPADAPPADAPQVDAPQVDAPQVVEATVPGPGGTGQSGVAETVNDQGGNRAVTNHADNPDPAGHPSLRTGPDPAPPRPGDVVRLTYDDNTTAVGVWVIDADGLPGVLDDGGIRDLDVADRLDILPAPDIDAGVGAGAVAGPGGPAGDQDLLAWIRDYAQPETADLTDVEALRFAGKIWADHLTYTAETRNGPHRTNHDHTVRADTLAAGAREHHRDIAAGADDEQAVTWHAHHAPTGVPVLVEPTHRHAAIDNAVDPDRHLDAGLDLDDELGLDA